MYKHLFKEFDMKMYISLLVIGIILIIYTTIRINFLGNIPDTWGFNIASQLAWINIMYEIIQEGLLFPLYFIIGKDFKNSISNDKELLENKLNIGLIITISVFAVISLIIFIFTKALVVRMLQESTTIDATVYIFI